MQWLILYSHQNEDVLIGNYCAESKTLEIPVDQIGQNTKNELLQHKIKIQRMNCFSTRSVTHNI